MQELQVREKVREAIAPGVGTEVQGGVWIQSQHASEDGPAGTNFYGDIRIDTYTAFLWRGD